MTTQRALSEDDVDSPRVVEAQRTCLGRIEVRGSMSGSELREYCVVTPLRPMAVGAWIDRSHWPRHVTVCSNFR